MPRFLKIMILALATALIFLVPSFSLAGGEDESFTRPSHEEIQQEISEIKASIKAKGAKWIAGATSMNVLSQEERNIRLGILCKPLPKDQRRIDIDFVASPTTSLSVEPITSLSTAVTSLPVTFDWRNNNDNYVTGVRDQGNCGACWAFSSTAALESYTLITENIPDYDLHLSEQLVISCSGNGNCENGGVPVTDFFVNTGVPLESCDPYTYTDGNCANACQNWQNNTYKIPGYIWVVPYWGGQQTTDILKNAVTRYGPIVILMNIFDDFYSYSSGIYTHVSGSHYGHHAILLVGYDDASGYFIGKNSWGVGWGEQGFFRIAYSEVTDDVDFGYGVLAYGNPSQAKLNILSNPIGGGTVTAEPHSPTGYYNIGEALQLTAMSSGCYDFLNWSGDATGISNPVTVTMDSDKTVTANFSIKRHYLTTGVNDPAGGTVTAGGSYECGTFAQVTATPNPSYYFTGWSGDATGSTEPLSVSMSIDKNIIANFKPYLYLIINSSTGGLVSVNPDHTANGYMVGDTAILTAIPNKGYIFMGWGGDASGTTNPLMVTMNFNKNITANFGQEGLFLEYAQNGFKVTLSTTLYFNGSPISGKTIKLYENRGSGSFVSKGTANTKSSGIATKTCATALGSHTAYAKFVTEGGIPTMQSANVNFIIGKVRGLNIPSYEVVSQTSSGFKVNTSTPIFSWAAYNGATAYNIQISTSSAFPTNSLTVTRTYDFITSDNSTSISWPAWSPTAFQLIQGKQYYWRVQAILPTGNSMWSAHKVIVYEAGK